MSKNYSKKRRLKYVLVALACAASFSVTGLAAACKTDENKPEDGKTTSKEDVQLLKNGNFEFFTVPEQKDGEKAPEYLINTPDSWTHGGTSSYTKSGIIGTSDKAWDKLTADDLAERLDANNALDSSASDYAANHIDFNGMKSSDLLYKDSYAALKYNTISESTEDNVTKYYIGDSSNQIEIYKDGDKYYYDEGKTREINKDFIANPMTHNIFKEEGEPYYLDEDGKRQEVYVDENGDYFLYDEAKDDYTVPVGHVLMLHNYSNSNHNGIAQNYASTSISLPANTSAEVSVWVKTANLLYSGGKDANEDQDHGANITVTHTVGSSTLDDFKITSINTEKLLGETTINNGWVQYTVYINACNFASSNITLKLGLGESDHITEGYAFFDDVTVKQYATLDKCPSYTDEVETKINDDKAFCTLTSDASEKIFSVDTLKRLTEDGTVTSDRYSNDFHFLLDLASERDYKPVDLSGATAGLTVDNDNYTTFIPDSADQTYLNLVGLTASDPADKTKLPDDIKKIEVTGGKGLDVSKDLVALVHAGTGVPTGDYADKLNEALTTAQGLPKGSENDDMLVIFSAKGATYTATFDISVAEESYKIISFWVKTSDMNGSTAATVKITEDGNEDNSANVTLDTTNIVTDIDDEHENIYDNWVQCFFFVHNDTVKTNDSNPATLHVEFSFGNTTLKGTTITSYKAGWAAISNIKTLDVDEDVYAYTGSGSYTASLTISEEDEKKLNVFDEVYGSQTHEIANGIVDPASYSGTNGGSSKVVLNGSDDIYANPNSYAGLINKEYFGDYAEQNHEWYTALLGAFKASDTNAVTNWNTVFGSNSVQPLIIVNKIRQYADLAEADKDTYKKYYVEAEDGYNGETFETENGRKFRKVADNEDYDENTEYYSLRKVLNYGFVGNEQTVSADGYTTVSVRVKVSEGAVAYVYLVDTSNGSNVLGFNAPSYTFRYDVDGNVLKADIDEKASIDEQRANVLYTLRSDGLYEDKDGKLYANLWNYTELYTDETRTYFDKNGNPVNFEDLVEGESYYTDATHQTKAGHFLVTSKGDKVYEYKDGAYRYIVNGETQKEEINPFDITYANYDYSSLSEKYVAKVENTEGKWVTVNFIIHAGSESKTYRLELWSGQREITGLEDKDKNYQAEGAVIFDYSYNSVNSNDMLNQYENEIIRAYQKLLAEYKLLNNIPTSTENIGYYEKAVADGVEKDIIPENYKELEGYEILGTYQAHYYTYSLYDSASFVPFNKDAADENATGYDYTSTDYKESLAYLEITDKKPVDEAEEAYSYMVFVDYSVIDNDITLDLGGEDQDDGNDGEDKDEKENNSNVWLLASSIVLVVALLFAILAILLKDTLKKTRRNKVYSKNNYNTNKTNRYIRKLGIKKEEIEEVEAQPVEAEPVEEQVAETEPAETESAETEPEEEVTEQTESVESEAVETAPVEEPAQPEVVDQPVETQEPATENNAENTEKPEDGQE